MAPHGGHTKEHKLVAPRVPVSCVVSLLVAGHGRPGGTAMSSLPAVLADGQLALLGRSGPALTSWPHSGAWSSASCAWPGLSASAPLPGPTRGARTCVRPAHRPEVTVSNGTPRRFWPPPWQSGADPGAPFSGSGACWSLDWPA